MHGLAIPRNLLAAVVKVIRAFSAALLSKAVRQPFFHRYSLESLFVTEEVGEYSLKNLAIRGWHQIDHFTSDRVHSYQLAVCSLIDTKLCLDLRLAAPGISRSRHNVVGCPPRQLEHILTGLKLQTTNFGK